MAERLPGHEKWKGEVARVLDSLVAENFERLYHSGGRSNYNRTWGQISRELHQRYDLLDVPYNDSDYGLKLEKQRYIGLSVEMYSEEIFPWELSDPRTYRFVNQYGQLPKRLPDEWDKYELEERVKAGIERRERRQRHKEAIQRFEATHPEYALR